MAEVLNQAQHPACLGGPLLKPYNGGLQVPASLLTAHTCTLCIAVAQLIALACQFRNHDFLAFRAAFTGRVGQWAARLRCILK